MKIYTNFTHDILALDNAPEHYEHVVEVEQMREELFGNLCDACICGYRYAPAYELLFNDDGSISRDEETGELHYKTDAKGNRIQAGWQCYPFMDYQVLMAIQRQYEASQQQIDDLTCVMADVIGGVYNA
ncbi:hypothetical protein HMPREF1093_03229 [Hungatella hathewayi 12489931]|uniref:hypothetical protein n=1 Tax=Hungatella hathewayi TaxID=154046 RepID=UPI0002D1F8A6|nr:hypothetical protein [Hungatella hathewayi]ENY93157.1 hypothetical protein HMPREF1093_03229 [Hungatella hathewayi 12489931]DAL37086.1 MAG TPA_asm: hypothetical protein [Caudoviricetes sp.]